MQFRDGLIDVIRKGKLDKLRKMLEKNLALVDDPLEWESKYARHSGNILHAAAFFNQTEIIKFLVNEKDMDVNQPNKSTQRTPLHYACQYGGFESVSLLFPKLGANPTLMCKGGTHGRYLAGTPYELSTDERIKALLLPAHKKQMQQEKAEKQAQMLQDEAERQAREAERLVQERAEAEARIVGIWEFNSSTSEIAHKHELPGGEFHVTDAFNFAQGRFRSITEKLSNENLTQTEIFFKPEDIADNPTLSEAFAKLQELTGKTASTAIAQPRPVRNTGGRLKLTATPRLEREA